MINVLAAVPPAAAPAPSTDYDTGAAAGSAFAAASFFAPVVSAAAMAMAGLGCSSSVVAVDNLGSVFVQVQTVSLC
ncbi:hypothetical protein OsJ_05987 [Oryza sativa Japonica Group]|uniref:Uncharacterized protein n=1 Tax=Oryza sativa subsp. japonica TaxID=39947 RepID=B9F4F3_ORYSJ|nr:hypothetical protein OsJ_05987 [Oryza sativa Japonica Group]